MLVTSCPFTFPSDTTTSSTSPDASEYSNASCCDDTYAICHVGCPTVIKLNIQPPKCKKLHLTGEDCVWCRHYETHLFQFPYQPLRATLSKRSSPLTPSTLHSTRDAGCQTIFSPPEPASSPRRSSLCATRSTHIYIPGASLTPQPALVPKPSAPLRKVEVPAVTLQAGERVNCEESVQTRVTSRGLRLNVSHLPSSHIPPSRQPLPVRSAQTTVNIASFAQAPERQRARLVATSSREPRATTRQQEETVRVAMLPRVERPEKPLLFEQPTRSVPKLTEVYLPGLTIHYSLGINDWCGGPGTARSSSTPSSSVSPSTVSSSTSPTSSSSSSSSSSSRQRGRRDREQEEYLVVEGPEGEDLQEFESYVARGLEYLQEPPFQPSETTEHHEILRDVTGKSEFVPGPLLSRQSTVRKSISSEKLSSLQDAGATLFPRRSTSKTSMDRPLGSPPRLYAGTAVTRWMRRESEDSVIVEEEQQDWLADEPGDRSAKTSPRSPVTALLAPVSPARVRVMPPLSLKERRPAVPFATLDRPTLITSHRRKTTAHLTGRRGSEASVESPRDAAYRLLRSLGSRDGSNA